MTENFPSPSETEPLDPNFLTTMYQDLLANRPLEFEVYLGNPVRMAEDLRIQVPNLQALYAVARHINKSRTKGDGPRSPQSPKARQHLVPPRQSINGRGRGVAPRSYGDAPPVINGRGRPVMNGYNSQGSSPRQGVEGDFDQPKGIAMRGESIANITPPNGELDQFSHQRSRPPPRQSDYDVRSRELMLRERELQLREREIEIQRRQGRIRHNVPSTIMDDDEEEDDSRSQANISQRSLMMTGDNFDMMSMTGRKSRNKQVSGSMRGKEPYPGDSNGGRMMSLTGRSKGRSGSMIAASQATFDPLNGNPLMGFTSNRYPGVDTRTLAANSRANSLTSQRMDEMGMGPGAGRTASLLGGPGAYPVTSRGPPPGRGPMMMGGPPGRGRPLPSQHGGMDYGSRGYHDPGALAPGLPPKDPAKIRSITGSASASSASLGGNGESHSSSSSLEPPLHHGRI